MRKLFCLGILTAALGLLWGCGGVEPEKRAYPLVLAFDWKEGQYQVIYGMANLAVSTGQGKAGDDSSGGQQTLLFEGEDMEEILNLYNRTQEYYLDLGHVQAVILGKNLLARDDEYGEVLHYMENNPAIGDGAAVFSCGDPERIMKLNGGEIESLGTYLTGIYENRPGGRSKEVVTLQKVYRSWNEKKETEKLPDLDVKENFPKISA
ncbi:MAG: hypothetical protein ACOX8H_11895 [Ruminococcus sp.]|jgi:spore germination protein KB